MVMVSANSRASRTFCSTSRIDIPSFRSLAMVRATSATISGGQTF